MSTAPLLTDIQMADAAFDLLSSSGIERYARMSNRAALKSGLLDRLNTAEHAERMQQMALMHIRAAELASNLATSNERGVEEVELAIIISVLALTGESSVNWLLDALKCLKSPGLTWIAALARKIRSGRVNGGHTPRTQELEETAVDTVCGGKSVVTTTAVIHDAPRKLAA